MPWIVVWKWEREVAYRLGFEPHKKHMRKESRFYAKANTAAAAAFHAHPNANLFLRLLQFMHLQLRHQL
jgi:hypothetical protein